MNTNEPLHPLVAQFRDLLKELQPTIEDDFRAFDDNEEGDPPSMLVTFGANDLDGEWGFQTGDNSFHGGAYFYHHWGVVALFRPSDCLNLAIDAFYQIADSIAQDEFEPEES